MTRTRMPDPQFYRGPTAAVVEYRGRAFDPATRRSLVVAKDVDTLIQRLVPVAEFFATYKEVHCVQD